MRSSPCLFASIVVALALGGCAAPPLAAAPPEPSAPIAPAPKASPNDCGAPNSPQPCGGPSASEPKTPAPRMCTEMACLDGLTMTHRLLGAELAKGKHTFEIEADGTKSTCTIDVKDLADDTHADCADRLTLSIAPKSEMTTVPPKPGDGPNAPAVATRKVLPNSTEWRIFLEGKTPKSVRVVHKLGAKTVGDHKLAPKYEKRSPNGEGCEPTCSQGNEAVP